MNSAVVTSPPHNPLTNDLPAIAPANAQFLAQPRKLLIDGAWVPAASGKTFEVRDPSSDAVIAHCALGEAGHRPRSGGSAARLRGRRLVALEARGPGTLDASPGRLDRADADELAELEAIDNGKSVVMARHVDLKHALEVWRRARSLFSVQLR